MILRILLLGLGWATLLALLAPLAHTAWVSFSPDSLLTPPTREWSFRWYDAWLQDRRSREALPRTALVAIASASLSLAVALPLAYAIRRYPVFLGRGWLLASILVPACLPPAALGMGLLPLAHASGLWGTPYALILSHAALGMPVAFLVIRNHLTHRILIFEDAARGLGASFGQTVTRITFPLLRTALAAAGVAVFVLSWNESLVTLFLAAPTNETVPAVTWPQLRYAPTPLVAVSSCLCALVGTLGVISVLALAGIIPKDRQ